MIVGKEKKLALENKNNENIELFNKKKPLFSEVIDDRGSSSTKITSTVRLLMVNVLFFVLQIC